MRTLLAAAVVLCSSVLGLAQERPDLKGAVHGADDKPVPGETVYVWTAGVKRGYSVFCPSCYLDCGKHAATGAEGEFTLPGLDPELIFRLLVVADGYQPQFVTKVDPLKGEPVNVTLAVRAPPPADSPRVLRGVVKDGKGRPLAGAAVSPEMVYSIDANGRRGGRAGAIEGLDPLSVTNDRGEFELVYKDPTVAWDIEIKARGFARQVGRDQRTGTPCNITMHEGAIITGRLVRDGKPVPYVQMGICHTNRITGGFLGHDLIGTDGEGGFSFSNVPAGVDWYLYSTMESTKDLGATKVLTVSPRKDGEVVDVGEVVLEPAFRFRGRVVLSDGKPVPAGMRILLSHHMTAWDSQNVDLSSDGGFEFTGLSKGEYMIVPAVEGYHLSRSNPSLAWGIDGLIDRDIRDFVIIMDPGKETYEGRVGRPGNGIPLKSATPP